MLSATYGLKHNMKKSEMLMFGAGIGAKTIPSVIMNGWQVHVLKRFKYLGD